MSAGAARHADENLDLLPVVDERDRLVGLRPRGQVHRERLLHRAVQIGVFDGRGRLWLQLRSPEKDTWPGAWDLSVTGHVAPGETYDEAARRELAEELGIEAVPRYVAMIEAGEQTGWEFQALYVLRWEERIKNFNRREITRVRPYAIDAIERILDGGDPRMRLTPGIERALPLLTGALPERLRADHPRPLVSEP